MSERPKFAAACLLGSGTPRLTDLLGSGSNASPATGLPQPGAKRLRHRPPTAAVDAGSDDEMAAIHQAQAAAKASHLARQAILLAKSPWGQMASGSSEPISIDLTADTEAPRAVEEAAAAVAVKEELAAEAATAEPAAEPAAETAAAAGEPSTPLGEPMTADATAIRLPLPPPRGAAGAPSDLRPSGAPASRADGCDASDASDTDTEEAREEEKHPAPGQLQPPHSDSHRCARCQLQTIMLDKPCSSTAAAKHGVGVAWCPARGRNL